MSLGTQPALVLVMTTTKTAPALNSLTVLFGSDILRRFGSVASHQQIMQTATAASLCQAPELDESAESIAARLALSLMADGVQLVDAPLPRKRHEIIAWAI